MVGSKRIYGFRAPEIQQVCLGFCQFYIFKSQIN